MPRRWMRSSGSPAIFFQSAAASSSSWKTVTQIFSGSKPYPPSACEPVTSSQA
ncbi:Uncharacterised protein [Cellulomonas fimi]|nr:Uncharacterised protein [Cellulomonas fimi]